MQQIPTIASLYTDVLNDLQAEYGFAISVFGKVALRVVAAVQAGKLKLLYLFLGFIQRNMAPDLATPEAAGGTGERWGRIKLNRNPFGATQGKYTVTVTGVTGGGIDAQVTFLSNDTSTNPGHLYQLDTAFTLSGSTGSVVLRSLDAGTGALLQVGDTLTATQPLIGANQVVTVTAVTVSPIDAETFLEYMKKVVTAFRLEPQGGAKTDYQLWGLDAAGVVAIYPYAASGAPNEGNVYVEASPADSTDGHGTPGSTILNAVAADIELDPDTSLDISERGRRPMTVFAIHVLAIVTKQVNVTFSGSAGTIPIGDQTTITAALKECIDAVRPYIAGAGLLSDRNDLLSVNKLIAATLGAIPGSIFTSITMTVGGGSVSSYLFDNGEIPWLGTVTYP